MALEPVGKVQTAVGDRAEQPRGTGPAERNTVGAQRERQLTRSRILEFLAEMIPAEPHFSEDGQ